MRRRIEHDLRTEFVKYVADFISIANTCNQRQQLQIRIFAFELLLDFIRVIFVNIKNNQLFGVMRSNLTAKLAADRTAAARYKHRLVFNVAHDFVKVDFYLLSTQKVLDFHVAEF